MKRQNASGSHEADVVIVGGGVIGCAIAYDLAKGGARVTLLERNALAQEASWASAGIISSPSPGTGDLGLRSFRRYPALIAEIEETARMRVGWNQVGETTMIGEDDDPRILQDLMEWQQQHGMAVQWLDGAALREHEPVLADVVGAGIYDPDAGSLRVHMLAQALARAAAANGATIREFTPVIGIESAGGRVTGVRTDDGVIGADLVVLAAGAWSHALGEMTGIDVPTRPVHGQMLAIADPPTRLRTIVAGFGAYILPRADGTIAAGATQEEIGFTKRVTPNGVNELIAMIDHVAPALNNGRLVETWSGLRPGNPDGKAIIGPAPGKDGLWIATGHFRGGALLAAATAELVASSILSGNVDPLLAPYTPARFG